MSLVPFAATALAAAFGFTDPVAVGRSGDSARAPAALAVGEDDVAHAVVAGLGSGAPFGVGIALSRFGGVWARRAAVGGASAMVGQPQPLLVGDEQLVAFIRAAAGPPLRYEVVLGRRARETASVDLAVVDPYVLNNGGRGLVAARAGRRVLIAWPGAFGGFGLVERR